uniref:Beta-glucosidase 1 n=1 Tax=Abies balsamea TaxID=90345 RepID=A0A2I7NAD5_ABIBA|nr:beta-glucosidase 1 [Abies balsamea]
MDRSQGLCSSCICFVSLYLFIVAAGTSPDLGRSSFPKGFKFGAGSSAYQDEGAALEGGKGPSIWDTFSHIQGKIEDGKNGDVAVDQYHRYKEDVRHLKYMGMDLYRFSISRSRIFPQGSPRHGGVNEEGITYYNNLINELLKNGMEPFVTLYHWDMPQALEDEYGGFRSQRVVEDIGTFAEECFRAFGDRVKYWTTINEPLTFTLYGYDLGIHAPGRCSPGFGNCTAGNSATEPYIVTHNMLLAHSAAVKTYRTKYQGKQKGSIGISLVVNWMVPYSNSLLDQEATQRAIDFRIGWFLDPLTSGKYPDSMRSLVGARLPRFSSEEAKDLKGSFDFLGYNYYQTYFTVNNPTPQNSLNTDYVLDAQANISQQVNGVYVGSSEGVSSFRSYPAGLREVINYTKHRYSNPPIYITETGYGDFDNGTTPLEEALQDSGRVEYYSKHLSSLLEAIREGADVRGYVVWSFLDGFEWASGYDYRFGLYYVDYNDNLKRYPRESANWFRNVLKS